MASPSKYLPGGLGPLLRPLWRGTRTGISAVQDLGHQATFIGLVLISVPQTLKRYRRQTSALLIDMTWGNGSIVVGGGTIGVLGFMGIAVGASVGIAGFATLDMVGMGSLTGFVSAYANTREMAPMIAAVGFAAQAGCRMTAEIGAMRISEEIDALEAQGIKSIPFVVTTRVLAGVVIMIPLFLLTLILSYTSCAFLVNVIHAQSPGIYEHYFDTFIHPTDVVLSLVKAVVFVVLVIAIQCYQGYYAGGGPEGVGIASGRAIRASLVAIVVIDMVLTLLFWGDSPGVQISG
ncbi:ABC transporter permease [Mycobacteroides chelonae]|uniref:ABC transporter permease n=1 Tax=Mycobacteroides chelonae TaxID=1774 RepID=UPI0008A87D75|nr:ABC transporter permease [Mycobacteroides chelonae]OHU62300.1 ABC transporter permease [Mycobacteroides chelonae]